MTNLLKAIQADRNIVRSILRNALDFEWSLQGFGMLRLYLTKDVRLHVWDDRYQVNNVSLLHDHPWDFESYIVTGEMRNTRYTIQDPSVIASSHTTQPFMMSKIQCGPGGGIRSTPEFVQLVEDSPEYYFSGDTYKQAADEIHKSVPQPGTVTIIERTFKPDTEHARVFWPAGTDWVSAEPRTASPDEVETITAYALEHWFPEGSHTQT